MLRVLAAAVLIAVPAWCQNPPCDSCRYGMVHVTAGQTLQVNAAAPPGQSCSAQIAFNDAGGNPLQKAAVVALAPGTSKSVGGALGADGGDQTRVRPVRVSTVSTPVIRSGGGAVELAFGQSLSLNVVAPLHPPNPCIAGLSFVDSNGAPLGPAESVTLAPGHGDSRKLNSIGLAAPLHPIVVQPNVALARAAAPPVCVPTVEVFDNFTLTDWIVEQPGLPGNGPL